MLQPDGKIVAARYAGTDFALVRYRPDGTLDAAFDGDGKLTTDFGSADDRAHAVVLQPDGRIVAAGYAAARNGTANFALARYNANGTLDKTFNKSGKVTTDFAGGTDVANGVAVQSDGRIVAVGLATLSGTGKDFAVARYNANGTLDGGFDGDGRATVHFGSGDDQANGIAVQADGKVVAAGYSGPDFAVARFNANGSLDTSFDGDGRVVTDFGTTGDAAYAVAVQADGRIVAAGGSAGHFALARYHPDGAPDGSFGVGGRVTTDVPGHGAAFAVAVAGDGRIVAAGIGGRLLNGAYQRDVVVGRYLPSAPAVGSFAAAPGPDGTTTLTAGTITDGNPGATIARVAFYVLNADGTRTPLGDGARNPDGTWALAVYLPPGTYTLLAEATDSFGVVGGPGSLALAVA